MYEAYSAKRGHIVNAKNALDYKEIYHCPNPSCSALYKLRSITGDRAAHFARLPSTPHSSDCIYEYGGSQYIDTGKLIKSDLVSIMEGPSAKNGTVSHSKHHRSNHPSESPQYIATPRQLLKYCVSNSITTEYLPGLRVDDIVLDSRNLVTNRRFEGIAGLRLLIGRIERVYPDDMIQMIISANTATGLKYIRARLRLPSSLYENIVNRLCSTYGHPENAPIAVLEDWKIEKKYCICCRIANPKHIILL